jgi:hypothetical protein
VARKRQFQNFNRGQRKVHRHKGPSYKTFADLLNYIAVNALPATVAEMEPFMFYAIDSLAEHWQQYPNSQAVVLLTSTNVGWIEQLLKMDAEGRPWALHGDGTHKIHIGRWVLMVFGTHCLVWDADAKVSSNYTSLCVLMHVYTRIYH